MADKWLWLNYHHLLYFVAVVEEEGLVPAAERLGVSHPTVSEQVRKLQTELGLTLFEKRGRRLQLTEDGAFVYEYARELFGVGAALVEAVEARRTGRTVIARVGVDSVLPKLVVRQLLSGVFDRWGDALRLRCVEDEREPLIAQLRVRRMDVVLSDAPARIDADGLRPHLLARSEIGFFAAPSLVASLEGSFPDCLDEAPFLLPLPATRLRRELERWLGERRLRPRVVGEIADSGLLKSLGQEGRGVFAVPTVVREVVERQYGVTMLGRADGLEAGVFALTTAVSEQNHAVRTLLEGPVEPDPGG